MMKITTAQLVEFFWSRAANPDVTPEQAAAMAAKLQFPVFDGDCFAPAPFDSTDLSAWPTRGSAGDTAGFGRYDIVEAPAVYVPSLQCWRISCSGTMHHFWMVGDDAWEYRRLEPADPTQTLEFSPPSAPRPYPAELPQAPKHTQDSSYERCTSAEPCPWWCSVHGRHTDSCEPWPGGWCGGLPIDSPGPVTAGRLPSATAAYGRALDTIHAIEALASASGGENLSAWVRIERDVNYLVDALRFAQDQQADVTAVEVAEALADGGTSDLPPVRPL